jgi:hypothetical protein
MNNKSHFGPPSHAIVMKKEEALADRYLRSIGFVDPVFEPDGNVPPDFVCDGRIAIEVTRLNQRDTEGAGLEERSIPLTARFVALLASLGPPAADGCYFVGFTFRRPLERWPIVRERIKSALLTFDYWTLGDSNYARVPIAERFEIAILRANKVGAQRFVLAGLNDHDSGGWIVSELMRNIEITVAEKAKKVQPYRSRYPEWWLVLVDTISLASSADASELRAHLARSPNWTRVVLIDPRTPESAQVL